MSRWISQCNSTNYNWFSYKTFPYEESN